jgi:sugar lactone lactonase YvrE
MTSDRRVHCALSLGALLGEGPVWDAVRGCLLWLDIDQAQLHWFDPLTETDRCRTLETAVTSVAPRATGGLIATHFSGFALLSDTGEVEMQMPVEHDTAVIRMNDGSCDPAGRFWAGSMPFDESRERAATLYVCSSNLDVRPVVSSLSLSNGLGWSPDGRTMYHVDTPTQCVWAADFEVESGAISHRRRAIEMAGNGSPDGLAVDAEGYLWIAAWGGSAVERYAPDGRRVDRVALPTPQVSSCAFAGDDLELLYITTAARGLRASDDGAPDAGSLFVLTPAVSGLAVSAFAG